MEREVLGSRRVFQTRGARSGFTLIEVLAVISMLGILIALTLVAVQQARESARKSACANNLRQLGIAVHSYIEANSRLPSGNSGMAYSPHAAILPFLSQAPLYNAINFDFPAFAYLDQGLGGINGTVAKTRLSVFLCPSDRVPPYGGWTNYAGNLGTGAQRYGYNGSFVLPPKRPLTLGDFRDGVSNTALFSEWVRGSDKLSDKDPQRAVLQVPTPLIASAQLEKFAQRCRSLDPMQSMVGSHDKGKYWIHGDLGTTLYNHVLGINEHSCYNGGFIQEGAVSAGSRHPGGAHVLYADGRVRYVKQGIALELWHGLGSRSGGEVMSDP